MVYYYVVTSLPPLNFGQVPELSFSVLLDDLKMNLERQDLLSFYSLLEPIDLYNMKALWLGAPLDDRGAILGKDLEESLLARQNVPEYVSEFLDAHDTAEERLIYYPKLISKMYAQNRNGFLDEFFSFERELSCVLCALRAKKLGRDLIETFQFEDPKDPFIAEILSQRDAAEYNPPAEYEDLKALFVENSEVPAKLTRALARYRFQKFEEWESKEHFTLDRILAFAARLLLVEDSLPKGEDKLQDASNIIESLSEYG